MTAPAVEVERELRRYATHFGGYIETKNISVPKKLLYTAADTIAAMREALEKIEEMGTVESQEIVEVARAALQQEKKL